MENTQQPSIDIHSLPVGTIAQVFFSKPVNPEDENSEPYWGRWLRGQFLWEDSEPPDGRSLSLIDDPIFNTGNPSLDVIRIHQKLVDSGDCQILIEPFEGQD